MDVGMAGSMVGFGLLIVGLFFFILHAVVCIWGYRDARRKGRSPEYALLVVLGLLFFPVLGLVVYLLIRDA